MEIILCLRKPRTHSFPSWDVDKSQNIATPNLSTLIRNIDSNDTNIPLTNWELPFQFSVQGDVGKRSIPAFSHSNPWYGVVIVRIAWRDVKYPTKYEQKVPVLGYLLHLSKYGLSCVMAMILQYELACGRSVTR